MDQLVRLAQLVAARNPRLFGVFLCSVCRSHRIATACRTWEPSDAELAALEQLHPWGGRLIGSSRRGAAWIRERIRRQEAGDEND